MNPVREDALFGSPELTCSRHHAAAVDPHGNLKSGGVLLCQALGRELGRAVKRDGRLGAEVFVDTRGANPGG